MKVYNRKDFLELENVLYMEIEEDMDKYQIPILFNQIFLKLKTLNENDFLLATIFDEMEDADNYSLMKGYDCKYIIDDTPSRDGCYHNSNDNDLFLVFDNDDIEEIVNKLNKIRFNGFSEWLSNGEDNE
jgi:hypothetical protein